MKTGIRIDIIRHDFWIPTYVGMTKKLKNDTYDTKPFIREGGQGDGLLNGIKNRLVMTPVATNTATAEGEVTDRLFRHIQRLAELEYPQSHRRGYYNPDAQYAQLPGVSPERFCLENNTPKGIEKRGEGEILNNCGKDAG